MDKWNSPLRKYPLLERRQFPVALFAGALLQSEPGHTSVLLRMHCPTVNAQRKDSPSLCTDVRRELISSKCFGFWVLKSHLLAPLLALDVPKMETTRREWSHFPARALRSSFLFPRYLWLSSKCERTTLTVASTGTGGYNIMIEYRGRATSDYPFSLPSTVPPLIIKLFSWKSSLFLNYLGRWSGNGIFRGGQSFLRERRKQRGKLIKKDVNMTQIE